MDTVVVPTKKARKTKRRTGNTMLLQVWVTPELYHVVDSAAMMAGVTMAEVVRLQINELKARQERAISTSASV